ncbi:MAG: hypothetical protein ACRYGR_00520 [Janthinobacterium lividum]
MSDTVAPVPKDLRILLAVKNQLASITVANGYQQDVSPDQIYIGKAVFGANVPLPALTILESNRPDGPDEYGSLKQGQTVSLKLTVQGWATDVEEDSNDTVPLRALYTLKADVMKCLARTIKESGPRAVYPAEKLFGRDAQGQYLVASVTLGPGFVRATSAVSQGNTVVTGQASFYLSVTIEYTLNVTDPYL